MIYYNYLFTCGQSYIGQPGCETFWLIIATLSIIIGLVILLKQLIGFIDFKDKHIAALEAEVKRREINYEAIEELKWHEGA